MSHRMAKGKKSSYKPHLVTKNKNIWNNSQAVSKQGDLLKTVDELGHLLWSQSCMFHENALMIQA